MAIATTPEQQAMPRALEQDTLCGAFQVTASERPDQVALRTRGGEVEITYGQYAQRVREYAGGLAALGVDRGSTVGFMLTNRPEFNLLDSAAMHLGATGFSIYNTSAPEQIEYVVGDADARVIVTELAFLERVEQVRASLPHIEHVVVVDGDAEGTLSLEDLVAGRSPDFDFEAAWRTVAPDDVLCLIYTSGTTGPPKGVQLTHANMLAECRALHGFDPGMGLGGRIISFLPAAHIADRWSTHYSAGMFYGFTVTCCADPREVLAYCPEVRPTVFGSVPRIWEKLKSGLEAGIDAEPDEQRRQAMRWAIDVGLRKVRAEQGGEPVDEELAAEHAKADELVLSAIRTKLGLDECEYFVAGAAATSVPVLEFFAALGIQICELWGMSELSCVATLNPRRRIKIGSVGPALPGVELRLDEDNEVLVRGPIVMKGYRNMPDKTAETIDDDGWLHTGDIGELDAEGYLKIVDRKKELIINAAGKNMSPANIEAQIKSSSELIGQACAIGDGRPYNVALIVLDPDGVAAFAAQHGLPIDSSGTLAHERVVIDEVSAAIERANSHLSRVEQIKKLHIVDGDWLPGGDELTPTMKLKRKPISQKYEAEIEALYA